MQVVVMPDGTEVEFPHPRTGKTSKQLLKELASAPRSSADAMVDGMFGPVPKRMLDAADAENDALLVAERLLKHNGYSVTFDHGPRPCADAKLAEIRHEPPLNELARLRREIAQVPELQAHIRELENLTASLDKTASEASKECERLRDIIRQAIEVDRRDTGEEGE